ncbi:hypothetical protein QTP70_004071 [Hemibagrus guttatus]|uniref:Reverse transcriptase n=1 Tax=Hemibagrus guttatus TaxID=175788 RepID=A0AAE0R8A4_9TELE|nr:hypothetical protein QTP70_004071 [Hemibagrus guttatus]
MKMDIGTDVTALPESIFTLLTSHKNTGLKKTRKTLMRPERHVLDVKGVFSASISKNDKNIEEDIYVVKNLFTPLLGRHAIEKLNLITRLDNITDCPWQVKYPELFTGLGELKEEYSIKLQPSATPYSVNVAGWIPVPLMDKVKKELSRMEKLDIIQKVEGPSDWCSGMVPVLKPDNMIVKMEELVVKYIDKHGSQGMFDGIKNIVDKPYEWAIAKFENDPKVPKNKKGQIASVLQEVLAAYKANRMSRFRYPKHEETDPARR